MIMHPRSSAIIGIALFTISAGLAWPQQSAPSQSSPERHDPATSGAGPTSGAPGLHPNDPPKGSSITNVAPSPTSARFDPLALLGPMPVRAPSRHR